MVTFDDVLLNCVSYFFVLIFSILIYKQQRYAYIAIIAYLIIQAMLLGKYSMVDSIMYLSAQMMAFIVVGLVCFINPGYTSFSYKKLFVALSIFVVGIGLWSLMIYYYLNPYIYVSGIFFGFVNICYMMLVLGAILLMFGQVLGLVLYAISFVSYSLYYATEAVSESKEIGRAHV